MAAGSYLTDSTRWAAVAARDPAADGHFVYCVKTTRIYCRPICAARLARRSNVEFFVTGTEAKTAGYRACKRCKPELEQFVPEARQAIDRVRISLEKLPDGAPLPTLETLAADAGMTKYHFHRCFKKATGYTPRDYILSQRQGRSESSGFAGSGAARSTPSLVPDETPSGYVETPDMPEMPSTPGLDFDDWLVSDSLDPVFFDNSASFQDFRKDHPDFEFLEEVPLSVSVQTPFSLKIQ